MILWDSLNAEELRQQLHKWDDINIIGLIEALIKSKNVKWELEKIIADLRTGK